jgi:glycosyltransferase involved in cell wall biosynthesis
VLFVGQWLRDFETLHGAYQNLRKMIPRISMDCVIPKTALSDQYLSAMVHDESVRWHCDLSDRQLRTLYREATVLFLPLCDAVANNALLEALATGLPIVTTDVGDVSFYLRGAGARLCQPRNTHEHATMVQMLCHGRTTDSESVVFARSPDVQHLEWNSIAQNTLDILGSLRRSVS